MAVILASPPECWMAMTVSHLDKKPKVTVGMGSLLREPAGGSPESKDRKPRG